MPDVLDTFARRLRGDTQFLASAMEDYAQSEGLNGEGLVARLGVRSGDLGRLGLCRRPSGATFVRDVEAIAQRFSLDGTLLAEVVRRSDALEALRSGEVAAAAALLAARDREIDEVAADLPPDHNEPGAHQSDEDRT